VTSFHRSRYSFLKGSPIFVTLFVLMLNSTTVGQQTPMITQYMFTNMFFNPAYAGSGGGICAKGLFRQQWIGFKDMDGNSSSPQTILFTVDAPIKFLHGGVGGTIYQDKVPFLTILALKVGYAFKLELGPGDFSIGVQLGFQNPKMDFSKYQFIDQNDELLMGKTNESDFIFDMAAGLFYKIPDKFYVGVSSDQLLQSRGNNTHYQLRRHYYLTSGYQWAIPNHPAFELQPSLLFLFDGSAFQLNVSALLQYNNKFYGGLAYRITDAVSVLAGIYFKGFHIGAAYDISTSSLTNYNSGSIEVMLGYCFKIETDKFRKSYHNTRFL